MPASAISFILMHIYSNIPKPILDAAFEPRKNQTTLDERIMSEVVAVRVLMDVNLISGLRTRIPLLDTWKQPVEALPFEFIVGSTYDASYYFIPEDARRNRNIIAIEQIQSDYSYTMPTGGAMGDSVNILGNSVQDLARSAITSRTQFNQPIMPQALLLGNNLVRIYPSTYSSGLILQCVLEFDAEFTNMNQNMIIPLRNLALCAVKAYIYNELRIKIDSTAVVGGMEIGVFKDIVVAYEGENEKYEELLMQVRGSSILEPDTLTAFAQMML